MIVVTALDVVASSDCFPLSFKTEHKYYYHQKEDKNKEADKTSRLKMHPREFTNCIRRNVQQNNFH